MAPRQRHPPARPVCRQLDRLSPTARAAIVLARYSCAAALRWVGFCTVAIPCERGILSAAKDELVQRRGRARDGARGKLAPRSGADALASVTDTDGGGTFCRTDRRARGRRVAAGGGVAVGQQLFALEQNDGRWLRNRSNGATAVRIYWAPRRAGASQQRRATETGYVHGEIATMIPPASDASSRGVFGGKRVGDVVGLKDV